MRTLLRPLLRPAWIGTLLLCLGLVVLPSVVQAEEPGRKVEIEATLHGLDGYSLDGVHLPVPGADVDVDELETDTKLYFHLASFQQRNDALQEEIQQLEEVEAHFTTWLTARVQPTSWGDFLSAMSPAHPAYQALHLAEEGQEARRVYAAWRLRAAQIHAKRRELRDVRSAYFEQVADDFAWMLYEQALPMNPKAPRPTHAQGSLTEAELDKIVAALRKKTFHAWDVRVQTTDAFLETTVRAEASGPGVVAATRTAQSVLTNEPGSFDLRLIERFEAEREPLLASIQDAEKTLLDLARQVRKAKQALEDARASPEKTEKAQKDLEALEKQVRTQQKVLTGTWDEEKQTGDKGLRLRLQELDQKIAEAREEVERLRQKHRADAVMGGEAGSWAGAAAVSPQPAYAALEIARVLRARATGEVEHLCALLHLVSVGRLRLASESRRAALSSAALAEARLYDATASLTPVELEVARRQRDAVIDIGSASLVRRAMGTSDALLAQNEYFHALITTVRSKQLRIAWYWRPFQWSANYASGVMNLTCGALDGLIDQAKQILPSTGLGLFRTKSEKTYETFRTERTKVRRQVAFLDHARTKESDALWSYFGLAPDRVVALAGAFVAPGEAGKARDLLRQDMAFYDATNGGLRRIAASFDATLRQRIESEYLIAQERAELTLRQLVRAERRMLGADVDSGDYTASAVGALILSPMKMAHALSWSGWGGGRELDAHIVHRREQAKAMADLLVFWRAFEFDAATLWHARNIAANDEAIRKHGRLMVDHPDYRRFWEAARALRGGSVRDLLVLTVEAHSRAGNHRAREYAETRLALADEVADRPVLLAGALLEDAKDRAYQGDLMGAYASAAQANAIDWTVLSTENLRTVEQELAFLQARDTAIGYFTQLGDQALYAALSAYLFPPGGVRTFSRKTFWKALMTPSGTATTFLQLTNPFSRILTRDALVHGDVAASLVNAGRLVTEPLAREALREHVFSRVMPPEFADLFAMLLVDFAMMHANRYLEKSWVYPKAQEVKRLKDLVDKVKTQIHEADNCADLESQNLSRRQLDAFAKLSSAEAQIAKLRKNLKFWQDIGVAARQPSSEMIQKVAHLAQVAKALRNPTTLRRINNVLTAMAWRLDSEDPAVRRRAQVDLWRVLGYDEVAYRWNDIRENIGEHALRQLDRARRDIVMRSHDGLLAYLRSPQATPEDRRLLKKIKAMVYTGSGGRPDGPEYKLLKSDLDVTLLVDDTATLADRELLRKRWGEALTRTSKTSTFAGYPEGSFFYETMVDTYSYLAPPPKELSGLHGADYLKKVQEIADTDPEYLAKLLKEERRLDLQIEAIKKNIVEPEKYITPGRLRALNWFNTKSGKIYVQDPDTGKWVPAEEATGKAGQEARDLIKKMREASVLEKSMASDIALDDLGFLEKFDRKKSGPKSTNPHDLYAFADKLSKRAIRILMGYLITNDHARAVLNGALEWPNAADHGSICDLAEILQRRAQADPDMVVPFTADELLVIRELKKRKYNVPMEEMLAERANRIGTLAPGSAEFRQHMLDHIGAVQKLIQTKLLPACLEAGATEARRCHQMMEAARKSGKTHVIAVYERKLQEILTYTSGAYQKLTKTQKAFVNKSFQGTGLDFDRFLADNDLLKPGMKAKDPNQVLRVYMKMTWYLRARESEEEEERRRAGGGGR